MSKADPDGGFSVTIMLFLIFLTLKLCKVIDWSWWWITAPLWGVVAIVFIIAIIWTIVEAIKIKRNESNSERTNH